MTINTKVGKPKDYHCDCEYCKKLFKGELKKEDGTYYSARKRSGYSPFEKKIKHLCPGHWQGFQFAIEKYTKEGDIVLDPFSGTGTAIVEALKLGRKGVGLELEFFKILKENTKGKKDVKLYEGDCRENISKIKNNSIDLMVTGPPYNNNSDGPERKQFNKDRPDNTFNYSKKYPNFAFLRDSEYYKEFEKLFKEAYKKVKKGGHFILIIKDPVRKKAAYLLHKQLGDVLKKVGFTPKDVYIHYHWPPTLFMNTYNKRFPEVKIPKYQTILVFKK